MIFFFTLIILFAVIVGGFLAACVAIGLLLHWLVPAIEVGSGSVVAALALTAGRRTGGMDDRERE